MEGCSPGGSGLTGCIPPTSRFLFEWLGHNPFNFWVLALPSALPSALLECPLREQLLHLFVELDIVSNNVRKVVFDLRVELLEYLIHLYPFLLLMKLNVRG